MNHIDRRRFSRVNFDAHVELSQENRVWEAELEDISLKGLLLTLNPTTLNPKQPLHVKIVLSDQTAIFMKADIVHQSATQLGLSCSSIDLDSIGHLRRLIELNLGDPTAAERELVELLPRQ